MSHPQAVKRDPASPSFAESRRSIQDVLGFGPALSSETLGWETLALFSWQGPCPEAALKSFGEPVIVYHVGGPRTVPVHLPGGPRNLESHPGLVTIIPPGHPVIWNVRGKVDSRSLHLASRFFEASADSSRDRNVSGLRFQCAVRDPLLVSAIHALEAELKSPREHGSLYADSATHFLACHLLRLSDADENERRRRRVLSRRQLGRVIERIEASIECGIGLQSLAEEVSLSRSYFASAFRESTGVSPYRYLKLRRLNRASELLRDTALSLSEIALRCGFSSQAHFTVHFHREYGVTPGRFRCGE